MNGTRAGVNTLYSVYEMTPETFCSSDYQAATLVAELRPSSHDTAILCIRERREDSKEIRKYMLKSYFAGGTPRLSPSCYNQVSQ